MTLLIFLATAAGTLLVSTHLAVLPPDELLPLTARARAGRWVLVVPVSPRHDASSLLAE